MTPADGSHGLVTGSREMDEEHALQLGLLRELGALLYAEVDAGR